MPLNATGRARFESEITDLSVIVSTGISGIAAVAGVTSWGDLGTSRLVGNWTEFQKYFGGLRADTDFPEWCKIMLDRGAKLRVGRIAHFTALNDRNTITATKATAAQSTTAVAETKATATATVTTVGATNDVYTISTAGYGWSYTQTAGNTNAQVASGLQAAINAGTAIHGYSAAVATNVVTITAPTGSGAGANGQLLNFVKTGGTGTIAKTNFAGGVTAILFTGTMNIEGGYATDALNGTTVQIINASSGDTTKFDAVVTVVGMPFLTDTVKNLNRVFTQADKDKFNAQILHTKITTYSGSINNGTLTLAGGTLVLSALDDNDYIGDATGLTGIRCFDGATDFVRLAVPEKATLPIDNAVIAYVNGRQDCRAILRTPMSISGATAVDYRNKTGIYAGGTPIDNWIGSMVYGDVTFTRSANTNSFDTPAVISALIAGAYKDNKAYAWYAAGGSKRGKIAQALGVTYNLASPARSTEFDNVDAAGINAVINDDSYGVCYWGNGTLQRTDTLLKHENVADLMIFLRRTIAPIVKGELFDPNDVETWKNIYRGVKRLMDFVQKKRGVWKWMYQGDQDITDVSEAVVNAPNAIDAGSYVFNLWISPKVGMKYAGMRVVVTNSSVNFEDLADQTF